MPFSYSFQLRLLGFVALLLVMLELINLLTGYSLNQFGLVPRQLDALPYIFTAPLLHGSVAHLAANLLPLLIFLWLAMQWQRRVFIYSSCAIFIVSGIGVWLFGRHASHVGASGIVYGYFGFLLVAGYLSKRLKYLLISLLVAAFYGSMVFGVLPSRSFISFEYHLFGFIAGILSAWAWARPRNHV